MKRSRAILFARPSPSRVTHKVLSKTKAKDLNELFNRLTQSSHRKPLEFSDICIRGVGKVWLMAFCEQYRLVEEFKEFEIHCRPSHKWIYATVDKKERANRMIRYYLESAKKSATRAGLISEAHKIHSALISLG